MVSVAALAAATGSSSAALAQQATDDQIETVVVTPGYVQSLGAARAIKKDADIQEDAIVAEDMAKFPELNLAESLQRLPGVQITREAGEGREISLQGLGPDFTRVQLNGMEVLGNDDSALDARGQRSRDRAFDFNIFASEMFSKAVVEKTFQAAQNEGGMAGTLGLFTSKPLDYDEGFNGAINAKMGTNQYTKDEQPRIAALFSYNWDDKFGIAVSVAWNHRKTTEEGRDNYNYDHLDAGDAASLVAEGLDISHLSTAQQDKFLSGDLYIPDGNRIDSWNAVQDRLGVTGAIQWKPVSNLLFTLDLMHSDFITHRNEYHLASRPINSGQADSWAFDTAAGTPWPANFQTPSVINNLVWDKNNYVTDIDVTNSTFGSEHRRELNQTHFNQIALTGKWDATDRLTIDGHVGYEKSTYDTPYDDKLYMRAKGNIVADYGDNGRTASFQYPGWDPTDPANYAMDDFYYRAFNNGSELKEGVLNANYRLDSEWTFRTGVAYHDFSNNGANYYYDGNVNGTNGEMQGDSVADITSVFTNSFGSWLVGDFDKAFAKYDEYHRLGPKPDGTGGTLQDIEQVYTVEEKTVSYYAQVDWDSQMFGKRFRGNLGLRGYDTHTSSTGRLEHSIPGDSYAYTGTATVKGQYSGVLPALNTVLELNDDLLLRFSATQNLNRPTLSSIAAKGDASLDDQGQIEVSLGNPNLKPFTDNTLDLAMEYYFGSVGMLSGGVFQKYLKNFIGSETLTNIPFSETGLPLASIPGATPTTNVKELDMPINVPGTKELTGVELAGQSQFTFLPAPFDDLGVIANYTLVDADQAITGISKTSYNATLYYETPVWSVRASLNHRSKYYNGRASAGSSPVDADTRGYEGSTYIDAAASYNITDKLQLTFDAINLTNQKDTEFFGSQRYLYTQTQSGTTYMVGAGYKF